MQMRGVGRRLAVAGLLAAWVGTGGAVAQTPIRIGAVLQLTGDLAWYGQEIGRGYELGAKYVNAHGGIGGRLIELMRVDVPSPTAALAEIGRLQEAGVKIVIGTGSSAVALAATPAVERNGMLWWESNALDNGITARRLKHVFQFAPNNDSFSDASVALFETLAPQMLGKALKDISVGLIYENSAYGTSQSKAQKARLEALGVKLVSDQSYDRKSSDLSPVVLQLREAAPDVLIETGYQDDIVLFWRQAKELGYLPKIAISSGAAATQDFANALGRGGVDGIIGYNYPFHEMSEAGAPGAASYAAVYQAAYGNPPPSGHPLAGYAAMLALADVMRAAGGDDPDAVAKAAHAMDKPLGSYPNGAGMKFTEWGRNERAPVSGFQWQHGKMVTIWPASVANGKAMGPLVPWDKR